MFMMVSRATRNEEHLNAIVDLPSTTTARVDAIRSSVVNPSLQISSTSRSNVNVKREDLRCTWGPDRDEECVNLLVQRVGQTSTWGMSISSSTGSKQPQPHHAASRWIVAGDSNMGFTYRISNLRDILIQPPCPEYFTCEKLWTGRGVNAHVIFNYPQPSVWALPDHSIGEGPASRGIGNATHQDCNTCDWHIMHCTLNATSPAASSPTTPHLLPTQCNRTISGGYVAVEFARDIEVQSPLHRTTQENFAHWLKEKWNTPELVQAVGKPVCVLSACLHDQQIPNMTTAIYANNVLFYMSLMAPQCSHIVWLGSSAPKTNQYRQTKTQTKEWNEAAWNVCHTHFPEQSSFVDVFDASIGQRYRDNVHLLRPWYRGLGGMLRKVIEAMQEIGNTNTVVKL